MLGSMGILYKVKQLVTASSEMHVISGLDDPTDMDFHSQLEPKTIRYQT